MNDIKNLIEAPCQSTHMYSPICLLILLLPSSLPIKDNIYLIVYRLIWIQDPWDLALSVYTITLQISKTFLMVLMVTVFYAILSNSNSSCTYHCRNEFEVHAHFVCTTIYVDNYRIVFQTFHLSRMLVRIRRLILAYQMKIIPILATCMLH